MKKLISFVAVVLLATMAFGAVANAALYKEASPVAENGRNIIDEHISTFDTLSADEKEALETNQALTKRGYKIFGYSQVSEFEFVNDPLAAEGTENTVLYVKHNVVDQTWYSPGWVAGYYIKPEAEKYPNADAFTRHVSVDLLSENASATLSLLCRAYNGHEPSDSKNPNYKNFKSSNSFKNTQWTTASGSFVLYKSALDAGNLWDYVICFDGLSKQGGVYVDNFKCWIEPMYDSEVKNVNEELIDENTVEAGYFYTNFEDIDEISKFNTNNSAQSGLISMEKAHSGNFSIKHIAASADYFEPYIKKEVSANIFNKDGKYKFSAWYYAETATKISFKPFVSRNQALYNRLIEDGYIVSTNDAYNVWYSATGVNIPAGQWTKVELIIDLPAYMLQASDIYIGEYAGKKTYYVDDITIEYIPNEIKGANVEFGSDLTLNYYASLDFANADAVLEVTRNGEVTTLEGVYDSATGLYKYAYTGINAQCMTDIIDARLLAADGSEIDTYKGYSIKENIDNIYADAEDEKLETLLADMLTYGAEAQKYANYKTDELADALDWVAEAKTNEFTAPETAEKVLSAATGDDKVVSAGLYISNVNKIYFRFNISEGVSVFDGDTDVTELVKNGVYYTDAISALDHGKLVQITLKDAGGNVLHKVQYSVDHYVANKYNDTKVGALVKAISALGNSAEIYNA